MQIAVVAAIAEEQWGLITTSQARAAGVSAQSMARLANEGVLDRLTHGVYRVVGAASPLDDLRAAWLGLTPSQRAADRLREPDAVLSHRSAAKYHQLGDLDADRFEFTVAGRKQTKRADVTFHREQLHPDDWQVVSGLPVTTMAKTIGDLAKTRTDGGHLAGVVRDAMALGSITADELSAALAPFAHHYGVRPGQGRALLQYLIEQAGLPKATEEIADLGARTPSQADTALLHALALLDPKVPRELRNRAAHTGLSRDDLQQLQILLGFTGEPVQAQAALQAAYEARAQHLDDSKGAETR